MACTENARDTIVNRELGCGMKACLEFCEDDDYPRFTSRNPRNMWQRRRSAHDLQDCWSLDKDLNICRLTSKCILWPEGGFSVKQKCYECQAPNVLKTSGARLWPRTCDL